MSDMSETKWKIHSNVYYKFIKIFNDKEQELVKKSKTIGLTLF